MRLFGLILLLNLFMDQTSFAQNNSFTDKQRLIILADMGNEPDEMQQMIHMITCSNEFDIEGLIAVTGKYLRPESHEEYRRITHPELFQQIIDAYEKDFKTLKQHSNDFPNPDKLRTLVAEGQKGYGKADIGEGKSSPGSELILKAASNEDPRPLWIVVNAGSNTLGQALFDYRTSHTKREMDLLISKLRVFENGAQDNAGAWICSEFPKIHWIRSNYQTYAFGGPGGKDGDLRVNLGPNYWTPYPYDLEGQLAWQKKHIMNDHGALGNLYPERRYYGFQDGGLGFMEGGGTIPWIGLINKGLFDINQPSWGGWGGRFSKTKFPDFWSRHSDIKADEIEDAPFYTYIEVSDHWIDPQNGEVYNNNYVPVWRWREAMYNDQICRMDWCVMSYEEANHHPVGAFEGDTSNSIIMKDGSPGEHIILDASGSKDPDGDNLKYHWWIYEEAGSYAGKINIINADSSIAELVIPTGANGSQIHVILEVKDDNKLASLFDYRRIVIDVDHILSGHKSIQKH